MKETITSSVREFAGYVDGFRARNLASIQQKTRVQVSEMETWLALLQVSAQSAGTEFEEFLGVLSSIESAINDSSLEVPERLIRVSKLIKSLITKFGITVKSRPAIHSQLNAFILAFIEAAQASGSQELFELARSVAGAYDAVFP
jgi:hypothetical protein